MSQVLSSANREQLRNAYVWFDWFSIPQIEVKSGGNDSEEMSSHVFLSVSWNILKQSLDQSPGC
jgi:hypothetical protein